MSALSNRGWSRVPVQTTSVTSENNTHLKWRAFLFSLILFVFFELAVVMYAGIGTARHLTAVQDSHVKLHQDTARDLRLNLGLAIENATSGKAGPTFLSGNSSMTYETFAEHYTEMCETYFIPRTLDAGKLFLGLFDQISGLGIKKVNHTSSILNNQYVSDSISKSVHPDTEEFVPKRDIETSIPPCPCVPDILKGQINVSLEVPYMGELELAHPELHNGGHWMPRDCVARHRTAIIIPFRDREEHLRILLNYLHPLLQRQMLYYTVFVVEQVFPVVFNKASIMNVGYREATLADSFDCFIFHDVDMIPKNDYNFYTCTPQPRHVGSHCDKFGYEVPYPNIFGGVTAFTSKQFIKVNGFSNEFYGWGGEDDDMYQRIKASGMTVSRFPGSIARYTMIKHGSDAGNPYNTRSYVAWQHRPKHYRKNGINMLRYYVRQVELRPLYTWLLVELPDAPAPPKQAENSRSKKSLNSAIVSVPSLSLICILLLVCFID